MKRKASDLEDVSHSEDESDQDSEDGPQEIVDVDFDFFNPDQVDYHALKRLLTQLFSSDAELLEIGDIVDIILEENHVGTTVKVDGQQSDPYAILSTINIHQYKDNKGIKSLYKYLLGKCPKKDEKLQKAVQNILSPDSDKHVGWVVSERFINMPMEIMPPMYAMMKDEIQAAIKKKEPYTFEWYMFIAKTYKEVAPTVDEEDENGENVQPSPQKKPKKAGKKAAQAVSNEIFYFQPEDEVIDKYATYKFDFKFTNREKEASSDARRAFSDFGIAPSRRLMFVHHSKFADLVSDIEKTCSSVAS